MSEFNELMGWTGKIKVTTTYKDGRVEVEEFNNLITSAGKNLLRDGLRTVTDTEIKYMAWGSSTTAPAVGDIALGTETGRKVITKQVNGSTGALVTTTYLAPSDANMQIQELGWFAGVNATATAGSGVLIARVLWAKLKTNLESVQIDRTDTIT